MEILNEPSSRYHQPVLLEESLQGLAIQPDGIYIDTTFGGGGHAKAILAQLKGGKLFAFDQDEDAESIASTWHDPNFTFIRANSRFIQRFLAYHQVGKIDGLIADLGVSSYQIDTARRGFSTRSEGPLDMRMDQASSLTASQIVNTYSFEALTQLFRIYGELHSAPALAKALIAARTKHSIETTQSLKEIALPFAPPRKSAKFLAQVFQALRIEVNDELGALKSLLEQSLQLLKPGGRLVVISYHSLEDRLVKRFIKTGNFEGELDKDMYGNPLQPFIPVSKKAIVPTEEELAINPRSRSAKLRVGERIYRSS
ncbi:MAG: 16S rRNA (cytosine(1402)-N(4))-methyltransferase RsmH [Candidatus Amoebophilus sp.]